MQGERILQSKPLSVDSDMMSVEKNILKNTLLQIQAMEQPNNFLNENDSKKLNNN